MPYNIPRILQYLYIVCFFSNKHLYINCYTFQLQWLYVFTFPVTATSFSQTHALLCSYWPLLTDGSVVAMCSRARDILGMVKNPLTCTMLIPKTEQQIILSVCRKELVLMHNLCRMKATKPTNHCS